MTTRSMIITATAVGVLLALALAYLVARLTAVLMIDLVKLLVVSVFKDVRCAVLHGGGTGAHCVRSKSR